MSPEITLSNTYVQYLSLPSLPPAPEHVKNLLSDYEITHILGSGGYAKVYKAIGPKGKEVALKVPKTEDIFETMDMEVINRFKSESELWMRLDHPNIVTLHSGQTEPIPHMAMELMDGGNLKSLMKNHNLTVGEAVNIMVQVLKGLSFAHRMASVHRDLKPENILFTTDGVAKITDWGIGKFMASAGKSQTIGIKGTLDYCAPEQYNKRQYGKVDWQTDIFQVGAMFYEMLTGENPFAGEDFADCMGKVLMFEPESPSALNRDVPEGMDEVILKAIAKKKEDRWDSGAVMLNELKRVISGKVSRGPKCSECGNFIDSSNRKLRCKDCRKYFCETCEGWIDKVAAYRGYKTKVGFPLCEDCYDEALESRKKQIDAHIKKHEKPKELSNSIGMKLKLIPSGEFMMGSTEWGDAKPHKVKISKPFYIGVYPVTQREWKKVMGDNPSYFKGDDLPVEKVSWDDCQEFVNKLNRKEGSNKYRLPTEAEWEYACRAGTTSRYFWGDNEDARRMNYGGSWVGVPVPDYETWKKYKDKIVEKGKTTKVGSYHPNAFGLYDMHGNVYEWCQDWYDEDYYEHSPSTDPQGPTSGSFRVFRGGSWFNRAEYCESSLRLRYGPDDRYDFLGVRLVRSSD